jgi:hypothetical protein
MIDTLSYESGSQTWVQKNFQGVRQIFNSIRFLNEKSIKSHCEVRELL